MIENLVSHLPHGKEIIAIKEIVKLGEQSIICRVIETGTVFNVIEYIAQAAALGRISTNKNSEKNDPRFKKPKIGMIIKIKEFKVFSHDSCETVECSWSGILTGVYEVEGVAYTKNGELIASTIMTMVESQ